MFYSHEILTSRKYGVATVWLVATLGAKSTTKKLNRKAILDVDVRKACNTITQPDAPMALRLQSNLLYGVSRVFSQQCDYVLSDAQATQNNIRLLFKISSSESLNVEVGKIRADQLLLMDDPAFVPDMVFAAIDFDLDFGNNNNNIDRLGSQMSSMLTPRSNSRSRSRAGSIYGINIPASSSGIGGYHLPDYDSFQFKGSSAERTLGVFNDDEQLMDDINFEFDAEGGIVDLDAAELERRRTGSVVRLFGHPGSDSAASGRVRREHEGGLAERAQGIHLDDDGDFLMLFEDDIKLLPDAEPFPSMPATGTARYRQLSSTVNLSSSHPESPISAEAPFKRRKPRVLKVITADVQIELLNSELQAWQKEYIETMRAANLEKQARRVPFQAKKNAYNWIWGNGIGNIGRFVRETGISHPLEIFAGENLKLLITGESPKARAKRGKRSRDQEEDELNDEDRRVRARQEEEQDHIGRGEDDDVMMHLFDESINLEVGRDTQAAFEDHHSSAMPWNVSASLHSYRGIVGPGSSSAQGRRFLPGSGGIGGFSSSVVGGRPGSRFTSASPLVGRGQLDAPDLGHLDHFALPMSGFDDSDEILGRGRTQSQIPAEEFEMFGPTAAVDTQTAQNTQWISEALAKESMNFLGFLKATITERETEIDQLSEDFLPREESTWIGFETMFVPEQNTRMVAAQAFHHVLTLATKNLLKVQQEVPFREILMSVIAE